MREEVENKGNKTFMEMLKKNKKKNNYMHMYWEICRYFIFIFF